VSAVFWQRTWHALALLACTAWPVVSAAQPAPSPTAIVSRIRSTGNRPIDFHAAVFPDTVYVGQQVTYQVAVLLSDNARSRLRRNPEFLPPELRGMLSFELGIPKRVAARSYGGGPAYETHVFQRALFAVTAGPLQGPAPQLTYSLPQSASYFSREERYMVRAESAQLVVRPLPTEGRPADFTGAVGVLSASARFNSSAVRVGDPLLFTVRLEGVGNVRLLPAPALELSWATVVRGSERVRVDTSGALVRGVKEFDYLVTPTRDGPVTLPVVRYPYFDPYREAYLVAETRPADVRVAAGDLAENAAAEDMEQAALRPWRHRPPVTLNTVTAGWRMVLLTLLVLAPLPAIVMRWQRVRRRRAALAPAPGTALKHEATPDDDSPAGVARRTRRTVLGQLAARLQTPVADLVTQADVERIVRRRGVTRATTRDLLDLLDDLAVAGFAPHGHTDAAPSSLESRAARLLQRVHEEAVTHGRTRLTARRGRRLVGVAFMLAPAALWRPLPAGAQESLPTSSIWSAQPLVACEPPAGNVAGRAAPSALDLLVGEGTAAYQARRFSSAAERFASAVVTCPGDVDLLVNWGTAAWAANDTVSAVIAWQRAARLDPLAADIQGALALLPSGARDGLADIPVVPVVPVALVALVAWCSGWWLLAWAWRTSRGSTWQSSLATVLVVAALAAGATAWWGHRALDASALAVVRRPETLRTAPGFDAATAGGVSTGDVVRLLSNQEGWSSVALADDRTGWIPASRLAPLVDRSATR
jgi:hypothetical protein